MVSCTMLSLLRPYEKKSPNARVGSHGQTRLSKAVGERHEAKVQALLAHPKIQVDRPDTSGRSPLIRLLYHFTIFFRSGPTLHAGEPNARNLIHLLNAGANPRQTFKDKTALVYAALEPFAAQQLLERGADPHACPQHHPFTEALKKGCVYAAEFWWAQARPRPSVPDHNPWLVLLPSLLPEEVPVPRYASIPRLPTEVAWAWAERLRADYPLDLRFPSSSALGTEGDTPLMAACRAGCPTTVEWLLDHGANAALGVGHESPFSVWLKQRNPTSRRLEVAERLFAAITGPEQPWEIKDVAAATLITACALDQEPPTRIWGWRMLRRLISAGFNYPGYSTESAKALEFWGMLNTEGAWEEGVDVVSEWPGWRANQKAGADTRLVSAMLGVVAHCAPERLTPERVRRWREAGLNWFMGPAACTQPTALDVLCQEGLEGWAHARRFPVQALAVLLAELPWPQEALMRTTQELLKTLPGRAPEGFMEALGLFKEQGVDFLELPGAGSLEYMAENNQANLSMVLELGTEVPLVRVSAWPEAGQKTWEKTQDRRLRERLSQQIAEPLRSSGRPRM